MLLNEGSDNFFMDLYRAREANSFTSQPFDSGAQRQVVTLNTLCEYFSREVFILRYFPTITAPVIAGYHTDGEGGQ